MEENKIETPLSEVDSNVTAEETLSTNTADSDVEEVQEFDPEVEAKAQELMELVKAYNKLKRKEANKYQVSKKENKKKKAKRRMAKKSKR
jgi:hypothetical protein